MAKREQSEPQDAELTFNLCDYDDLDVSIKVPEGETRFYIFFIRSEANKQKVCFGARLSPHVYTKLDAEFLVEKVPRRKDASKHEVTLRIADYKKLEVHFIGEGDERLCHLSTQGGAEREQSHFYVPGRDGSLHDLMIYPPDPEWAEK